MAVHPEYLRIIIDQITTHFRMARQETPLHYAAIRGNAEMIQLLLDARADVQMESKYGENPRDVAEQGMAAFLQSHDSSEVVTLLHRNYLKWRESRTARDLSPWRQKWFACAGAWHWRGWYDMFSWLFQITIKLLCHYFLPSIRKVRQLIGL